MKEEQEDNQIDLEDAIKYVSVQISDKPIIYSDQEDKKLSFSLNRFDPEGDDVFSDQPPQTSSYEHNQKMIAEAREIIKEATQKQYPYRAVVQINGVITHIETTSKEALKKYIDKSL
jgi:hypothetical protein